MNSFYRDEVHFNIKATVALIVLLIITISILFSLNLIIEIISLYVLIILILLTHIKFRKRVEVKLRSDKEKLKELQEKIASWENQAKKHQENMLQLTYYNSITKLPNKIMLREKIERLILSSKEQSTTFAVIYLDINKLKDINDSFGYLTGDKVLYMVGRTLKETENQFVHIFNLDGDKFISVYENFMEKSQVEQYVKKILVYLSHIQFNNENSFSITANAGIAIYPCHGENYAELLKNSGTAMHRSKHREKSAYAFFDKSMANEVLEKMKLQNHLCKAIENNEFILYYQPQYDVRQAKITSFEALLRWDNPKLGLVSPLNFIQAAEESNLIIPIGNWVLKNACLFIKELNEREEEKYLIAVNISVIQLIQEDFVENVLNILVSTKLSPSFLELEITESILMNSISSISEKLRILKAEGIRIALDDFGTGYSSLYYLYQLPISTIKIDKSFINSISEYDSNKLVTELIIEMGHLMGMEVVAEGIENKSQMKRLAELGCDKIQGYLISKPIPKEQLISFLASNNNKFF